MEEKEVNAMLEGFTAAAKLTIQAEMEHVKKGMMNAEYLEKSLAEKGLDKDKIDALTKAVEDTAMSVKRMEAEKIVSFNDRVGEAFKSKIEEIKSCYVNKNGVVKIYTSKAVEPLSTGSATSIGTIPNTLGSFLAPSPAINMRVPFINALISTVDTTSAAYAYTEAMPKEGSAGMTAEAALKNQIDFKIETRWATPKKVTAYEILSKESEFDIVNLRSIATGYLKQQHDMARQSQILYGDGIGENLEGAYTLATAFSAGPLANKVKGTNFLDVINAMITRVYTTPNFENEVPYMPNLVLVDPGDFFVHFVSAKTKDEAPLYPSASLFNMVVIGGVTIMPYQAPASASVPAGTILVADMTKYLVTNYEPYNVSVGWVNDQFIRNQFTMIGESRLHGIVKNLDKKAFIKGVIETVKGAITVAP